MPKPALERSVLMSVKPCYASLLFGGSKRVELRRRIGQSMAGSQVFVYVTSPVMKIQGGFRIERVLAGSPQQIWPHVVDSSGVERSEYDAYYEGSSVAYAIEIVDVWEYVQPVDLHTLRQRFDPFVVPQSWRYMKPGEYERLSVGACDARATR